MRPQVELLRDNLCPLGQKMAQASSPTSLSEAQLRPSNSNRTVLQLCVMLLAQCYRQCVFFQLHTPLPGIGFLQVYSPRLSVPVPIPQGGPLGQDYKWLRPLIMSPGKHSPVSACSQWEGSKGQCSRALSLCPPPSHPSPFSSFLFFALLFLSSLLSSKTIASHL